MTESVLTITPGLREAARVMIQRTVGVLVILDPEEPGPGIITVRDVVRTVGNGEDRDAGSDPGGGGRVRGRRGGRDRLAVAVWAARRDELRH